MVAIKDFGMPSCCENCDMYVEDSYCAVTGNWIYEEDLSKRDGDCPLVEIKEQTDGKA